MTSAEPELLPSCPRSLWKVAAAAFVSREMHRSHIVPLAFGLAFVLAGCGGSAAAPTSASEPAPRRDPVADEVTLPRVAEPARLIASCEPARPECLRAICEAQFGDGPGLVATSTRSLTTNGSVTELLLSPSGSLLQFRTAPGTGLFSCTPKSRYETLSGYWQHPSERRAGATVRTPIGFGSTELSHTAFALYPNGIFAEHLTGKARRWTLIVGHWHPVDGGFMRQRRLVIRGKGGFPAFVAGKYQFDPEDATCSVGQVKPSRGHSIAHRTPVAVATCPSVDGLACRKFDEIAQVLRVARTVPFSWEMVVRECQGKNGPQLASAGRATLWASRAAAARW